MSITHSSPVTSPGLQASGTGALKTWETIALRFFSLYFILQAVPLDWKFYRDLFSFHWLKAGYAGIFTLAHYTPRFFSDRPSYADWIVSGVIALAGTFIWNALEKKRNRPVDNDALYYWLRVIARYRLAIAVFAYGFIKLFPLLSPWPSVSNLNTQYGQYSDWKVFSLSLGVVPSYESFLGLVEILAASLLLFRKTAGIGAFILIFFIGNVFFSNLAYEGGEYLYSLYLVSLALVIFSFDIPRYYSLFGQEKPTQPNRFRPILSKPWLRNTRLVLKTGVVLLFAVYGIQAHAAYTAQGYKYPSTPGLPGVAGIYNVSAFVINKDTLQYSLTDSSRWQDIVFETWNTISIRTNKPVFIDEPSVETIAVDEKEKDYESKGAQSRRYYSYTIDSLQRLLILHNKNPHYAGEALQLHYERPSASRILLWGVTEKNDSVHAVLDKLDKKYLLIEAAREGRRKGIKL